jgi:uncharacterized membrane protein
MAAEHAVKRTLLVVLLPLSIAACAGPAPVPPAERPPEPAAARPAAPISARFDCGGEIVPIVFHADRSVITLPDRELTLPQAMSASGARYSDGATTFWNKGNEATFEIGGRSLMCRELPDPWREAGQRGVDFRAIGQEPGWVLDIEEGRSMHLVYDYAEREATVPASPPLSEPGRMTYTGTAGGQTITAVIEERRCGDGMSGEPFPSTVTVTIDGRQLTGCGRRTSGPQGP